MASGAISESTVMTGAMITGYNPKAEGTQTIKSRIQRITRKLPSKSRRQNKRNISKY